MYFFEKTAIAIHMSDIVSRIFKELLQLNSKDNSVKNGQRIRIDISSQKIYKCPISVCKDAQHH